MPIPADLSAADDESTSMSSMLLSQCSPNDVQPIPTMATRSRMPLLAMCVPLCCGEAYHAEVPARLPGRPLMATVRLARVLAPLFLVAMLAPAVPAQGPSD